MANREYAQALASLYALEAAKGMDFKLERVALALKSLGDPQDRFPSIHIAGTNGKGSVAAFLHAIYGAAGYRVGLYTSPHLVSFTERIRIGATAIEEDEVVELTRAIRAAATVRGIELTFFEFVTVMAFVHFARRTVDLAVVEVGLGGRLDATNVVRSEVAVITTIGLDHQEYLGDSIEAVAREKAGIIKAGRPVVIGRVPAAAATVLREVVAERGAPAYWAGSEFSVSAAEPLGFRGMGVEIEDLVVGLRGSYQRDNAALAMAAASVLQSRLPVSPAAMRRGLATVQWPGRMDVVQQAPLVVLDGAHNPDGVGTLVRDLPAVIGKRTLHLLFGVMRDKHWVPMVELLGPLAATAMLTPVLPPRGEEVAPLARAFEPYCPVRTAADPISGLEGLLESVGQDDAIVVTGSLFLIGAVYPHFLRRRGQPALFSSSAADLHP